jgi:polar amino acid transport system substrate-binding protein
MMLAAALLACASLPNRANGETVAMKELTPTGKLRAGIVYAPALSVFFAVRDADGRPRGVTVDLADELARQLGVAADFMVAPNSGLVTDAVESGAVDVDFMPVDDERKMRVAFGPNYCLIESTYMVTGASGIRTLAEVDRPNVRVVGIANTTTIRAAGRSLKNTTITAATSVETAVELLRTGAADAFALSRDSLPPFVAQLPGSRIVDGGFQQTGIAIAVAKGRPGVLAYVSAFLEHAKASGSVRRALDRAGFRDQPSVGAARRVMGLGSVDRSAGARSSPGMKTMPNPRRGASGNDVASRGHMRMAPAGAILSAWLRVTRAKNSSGSPVPAQ